MLGSGMVGVDAQGSGVLSMFFTAELCDTQVHGGGESYGYPMNRTDKERPQRKRFGMN